MAVALRIRSLGFRAGARSHTKTSASLASSLCRSLVSVHTTIPLAARGAQMMKKSEVIRLKQTDHVAHERALLRQVNHPFIVMT